MELKPKQKAFADYYIMSGNATEAAIKAGYSTKTARFIGAENLTKPNIKSYIAERNKRIETPRIADMTEVKEFWSSMLRDSKCDPKHRLKASEYIAKTNAAFVEKVEHSGSIESPQIVFNTPPLPKYNEDDAVNSWNEGKK